MSITPYDGSTIINRIIDNLKLDGSIFDEDIKNNKINTILFGDPPAQKWLSQKRPYIAVTQGEPFELSDDPIYTSLVGKESPQSNITLQFFITCIVDGSTPADTLQKDLSFRKALKIFFRNNPKMKNSIGEDPLFHRSKTTITPKFIRNNSDIISAFTVVLQGVVPSE